MSRGLVVARTPGRVTVQMSLYAAYRAFLDANRDLILVRPDGKTCHRLKANPEIADDREQPFSGVH